MKRSSLKLRQDKHTIIQTQLMTVSESQGIDANASYETQAYNLYGQNIKCTSSFQFCGSQCIDIKALIIKYIIIIKCPASWRRRSCLSKRRGLKLPTSYPSLFQHPTRTSGCPAFFLFVFPCFFSCLVYQW